MSNCFRGKWHTYFLLLLVAAAFTEVELSAYGENFQPDKDKAAFSQLKVKPSSLSFSKINFQKGPFGSDRSFAVANSGTTTLSVTVGNPSNSAFSVIAGGGPASLNAGGSETVTVDFSPSTAGNFKDEIIVSSTATKGKSVAIVKLNGSAKGNPGSGTPTPSPSPTPTPTVSGSIFATNFSLDTVTAYPINADGDVAPLIDIGGSNPQLFTPAGIAIDSTGNTYVVNNEGGNSGLGSVTIYPPGSNGNAAPSAIISGPNTRLSGPVTIALDSNANIYVGNDNLTITEYAAGSNGDVPPIATISGVSGWIAVDPNIGDIYVSTATNVSVFPAGSNGLAIPSAVISGPDTGLGTGYQGAIALNPLNGDIYLVNLANNSISVYPAGSNGDVIPTVVIRGPAADISSPEGIALDSGGNIYLVTLFDNFGDPLTGGIAVYAAGSNGNVAPIAKIGGFNTGFSLGGPLGIALTKN